MLTFKLLFILSFAFISLLYTHEAKLPKYYTSIHDHLVSVLFKEKIENEVELNEWENCKSPNDIFAINSLNMTPSQLVQGKNVEFSLSGDLKKSLSGDEYINIVVKLNAIPLYNKTRSLCDLLGELENFKCPISKGHIQYTREQRIPKSIPAGFYRIELRAKKSSNENLEGGFPLFCLNGNIQIFPALPFPRTIGSRLMRSIFGIFDNFQ